MSLCCPPREIYFVNERDRLNDAEEIRVIDCEDNQALKLAPEGIAARGVEGEHAGEEDESRVHIAARESTMLSNLGR